MFSKIKNILNNMLLSNNNLIIFPLCGAFIICVFNISKIGIDFSWINKFDIWASSIFVSICLYMMFDLAIESIYCFRKYKKIFNLVSFFVSILMGNSLTFKINTNIKWYYWLILLCFYIISFIFLFLVCQYGFYRGIEKAKEKESNELEKLKNDVNKWSCDKKDKFIDICEKALKLDNITFNLITKSKSKEDIRKCIEFIKK